jgi:hypothetical protein
VHISGIRAIFQHMWTVWADKGIPAFIQPPWPRSSQFSQLLVITVLYSGQLCSASTCERTLSPYLIWLVSLTIMSSSSFHFTASYMISFFFTDGKTSHYAYISKSWLCMCLLILTQLLSSYVQGLSFISMKPSFLICKMGAFIWL